MTGIEDYNYPAFNEAAEEMRELGWEVINPAENHGGRTDLPREEYFRTDIPQLVECDAILLLDDWEDSEGARLELAVARACGLRVLLDTQNTFGGMYGDDTSVTISTSVGGYGESRRPWGEWPRERRERLAGEERARNPLLPGFEPRPDIAPDPFRAVLAEMADLHDRKRHDYTGDKPDHVANYRFSGSVVGLSPRDAMFGRMGEKFYRLKELRGRQPKNEPVRDAYLDIAIISALSILNLDGVPGYAD